jgi:hypothetical protein
MIIRNHDHLEELISPDKVIIDFDTDGTYSEQLERYSRNAHFISLKALCKIIALLGDYNHENFITHIDTELYQRMVIKGICS